MSPVLSGRVRAVLSIAALLAVLAPAVASARAPRRPPRPISVRTSGMTIELKTTKVVLEANRPDAILEAKVTMAPPEPPPIAESPPAARGNASAEPGKGPANAAAGVAADDDAGVPTLSREEDEWQAACSDPCGKSFPRAALFRISGPGLTSSATFNLPPERAEVTVRVRAGTARWYWTGVVMSALGGALVVGGVAPPLLEGGSFSSAEKIMAGGGAALVAMGLPLLILNRTTVAVF